MADFLDGFLAQPPVRPPLALPDTPAAPASAGLLYVPQSAPQSAPQAAPQVDPLDYTDKYNTQLSADEAANYQKWLAALSAKNGRDMSTDTYNYDMRGAFKAGAGQAENGHFTDQFKKPNHPTFSDQSQYNGADGHVGGAWSKGKNGKWVFTASPQQMQIQSPEDLRSYFKRVEPDSQLVLPDAYQ